MPVRDEILTWKIGDEGLLKETVMRRDLFKPLFSNQVFKTLANLKLKDYLSCSPVVGVK